MTTATIEKPMTHEDKVEALLASGGPVRVFPRYADYRVATASRPASH